MRAPYDLSCCRLFPPSLSLLHSCATRATRVEPNSPRFLTFSTDRLPGTSTPPGSERPSPRLLGIPLNARFFSTGGESFSTSA